MKSFLNAFSHLRLHKLAHTFSDNMKIATKTFIAHIVYILIFRCIDAAYNEK